jgi:anaerobic magnesium-protoporphyrin IX monomethyl ester cyclase
LLLFGRSEHSGPVGSAGGFSGIESSRVVGEKYLLRVLLINPPPYQRVDEYDTPNFTRLGLACLAAQLIGSEPSAEVEIVDAKFERLSYAAVTERIRRFSPDIVGLTAFTNEIIPASRIAETVKAISPKIATVVGGVHATVLPDRTLEEFPSFDYAVVGEGEITFVELVRALSRGESPAGIPGVCVRALDRPSGVMPERPRTVNLDEFPNPAWELLPPSSRYLLMTQRGCAYSCTFCANPNGRTVRTRSVDSVMAELGEIVGRGGEELYICDELFTVDRERTHMLLDAMIAADIGSKLRWSAQTHVNTVDRDLFAKMKAAGCFICGLGIETGDPDIMKRMKKGSSMERVITARNAARDVGLPIEGLLIIGHPYETWKSAVKTIDFAVKLNPDRPVVGVMVPYPGTEVAAMAARGEGGYRLLSTDWNDYSKQIGHALEFENLSRRELEILQMLAYVSVFLRNHRYADFVRFVWKYHREGLAVLKKIVLGRMPEPEQFEKEASVPADQSGSKLPRLA